MGLIMASLDVFTHRDILSQITEHHPPLFKKHMSITSFHDHFMTLLVGSSFVHSFNFLLCLSITFLLMISRSYFLFFLLSICFFSLFVLLVVSFWSKDLHLSLHSKQSFPSHLHSLLYLQLLHLHLCYLCVSPQFHHFSLVEFIFQSFHIIFLFAKVFIVAPPFFSSHEANESHFACTFLATCNPITSLVEYQ